MTRERLLAGLGVGAIAVALVVSAAREARAEGEDVEPGRSTTQDQVPAARPPPAAPPALQRTSASPATGSSASPAAWSPQTGPRVTAGVLARAASRRAREREEASRPEPERRRTSAGRAIVSVEIDWHATPQAP